MGKNTQQDLQILSGSSHPAIAESIARELGVELCTVQLDKFANGEISARILNSIRKDDVFVVQSHASNVNDSIIEQAIIIDAAKRASAGSITAVCPFLSYARQDRKSGGREPISARLIIDILVKAGADRIMSVDLHSGQVQGFMDGPFDHLIARPTLMDYVKQNFSIEDLVVVSPDAGRAKSVERYARELNCEMAIIHKHRSVLEMDAVEARHLMGDVNGKICILIDDMIDTAGTICAAAQLVADNGAKEVYGLATHGIFSGPAKERISQSSFVKVITTDTLPQDKNFEKNIVLPIAPLLAGAIKAAYTGESVSALFNGDNQS
jgi:ribose-phosphate pyrophosphokinase